MEEIRLTTWDVKTRVNNGINYQLPTTNLNWCRISEQYHPTYPNLTSGFVFQASNDILNQGYFSKRFKKISSPNDYF